MKKLSSPDSTYSILEYSLLTSLLLMLFASLSFAQTNDSAMSSLLNRNLLMNPGAEERNSMNHITGWESITQDAQGMPLVSTGTWSTPGINGSNYFRAMVGGDVREASAYQYFDVSSLSELIDRGVISYNLTGSFGGGDYATSLMNVSFLDGTGKNIKTNYTKNIILDEVGADSLNIYPTGKSGKVPKATRKITVQLRFYKYSVLDETSPAFADDLGFYLYRK